MRIYIACIFIIFIQYQTNAQISCTSGENVKYCINNFINNEQNININNLSFTIKSSNPTVFYIDSIKINENILMNLQRNYWELSANNNNALNTSNIALNIYGTGLSGNDSTAQLTITDITYNDKTAEDVIINIKSKDYNINRNYAKFAKITEVYPNPITYNTELNIDYIIDIPSDIVITFANALGKIVGKYEVKNDHKGKKTMKINIDNNFASGAYRIMLETNSGIHFSSFSVVR